MPDNDEVMVDDGLGLGYGFNMDIIQNQEWNRL